MKRHSLYSFGIIFLMLFGLINIALCLESCDQSTVMDILTEEEVIMALEKNYKGLKINTNKDESSTETSLKFKIITPPEGGRIFTNKDQTHVTFSIDSTDKQSGIKMVCGTRITNISKPEFFHDDTPPFVLEITETPLGEQKFMILSINNAGTYESKIITVNVIKVTNFRLVPKN